MLRRQPRTSGRIFFDGCFVRYDNHSFFHEAIDPETDATDCDPSTLSEYFGPTEGGIVEFNRSVGELVGNITELAVSNGGFGTMELKGVYGLAQCWQTLTTQECRVCLNKATTEATSCLPSTEGRSMNAGCYLRYSTYKFFNDVSHADMTKSGHEESWRVKVVVGVGASLLLVLLICIIYYFMKLSPTGYIATIFKYKSEDDTSVEDFIRQYGSLTTKRYKYSDVKKMTNSFQVELGVGNFFLK